MAKKLTKEQLRQLQIDSYFNSDNDDDPLVNEVRANLKAEEERRRAKQKADFSDVKGGSSSKVEDTSFLGSLADKLQGSLYQAGAGALTLGADGEELSDGALDPVADAYKALGIYDNVERLRTSMRGKAAEYQGDAKRNEAQAATALRNTRRSLDGSILESPLSSLAETAQDVAGSGESFLSVIGGPTAVLPAASALYKTYLEGLEGGLTKEESYERAKRMATTEGAIGMIPGGRVVRGLLGNGVGKSVGREVTERIVGNSLMEGANEAVTGLTNTGLDAVLLKNGSETEQEFAAKTLPKNTAKLFERTWREFKAGALGGGVVATPVDTIQVFSERGKLAAEALAEDQKNFNALGKGATKTTVVDAPETTDITPVSQGDLFGTPDGLPTIEQFEAQRQKDLEIEAGLTVGRRKQGEVDERDRLISGIRDQLGVARQDVEKIEDHLMSQRPRGSRLGLDEMSDAEANTLAAAVSRVRDLENELSQIEATPLKQEAPKATPVTKEPEQLTLNVDTKQPKQVAAETRSAALKEANDLVKQSREETRKTAERQHKSARQAMIRKVKQESLSMDEMAATAHIADSIQKWDEANTVDTFVSKLSAPKETKSAPKKATVKAAPKAEVTSDLVSKYEAAGLSREEAEKFAAEDTGKRSFEDIKNDVNGEAMPTQSDTPKTGGTRGKVLEAIKGKVNSADGSVVAKLMADGNLVIVDDASQVPSAAEQKGDGFYDGKHTYVVADKLDEKNILGGVLSVAAHEVKHGADFAAGKKTRAALSNIIGKKANAALVKQIEGLANKDARIAEMVKFVKENAGENYELELPAYFIQLARARRDEKGALRRVANNTVAATKQGLRNRFGAEFNINEDDMAYLSDRLLKEVAREGKRLEADISGPAMPTIGGMRATGYQNAKNKYLGEDGKPRFAFSDEKSEINEYALMSLVTKRGGVMEGPATSSSVKASRLLHHPELEKNYPGMLEGITVVADDRVPTEHASFNPASNIITVSSSDVKAALNDETRRSKLRDLVLHELQHGVQTKEGFSPGSNSNMFVTEEDKKLRKEYDRSYSTLEILTSGIENNKSVVDKLDVTELRDARYQYTTGRMNLVEFGEKFLELVDKADAAGLRIAYGNSIRKAIATIKELGPKVAESETRAFSQYQRTYGEKEARFTERMSDVSQEDLDDLDIRNMVKYQDDETGESVFPDRVAEAAAMPSNFSEWFGNSKVVNEDGSPKVVYHGSKSGQFDVFDVNSAPVRARTGPNGAYFTDSFGDAYTYAGKGGHVISAYLSLQNPLDITADFKKFRKKKMTFTEAKLKALEKLTPQHDGYILDMDGMSGSEYVAFRPEQIKSAKQNNGEYSKDNPSMYASRFSDFVVGAVDKVKRGDSKPVKILKSQLLETGGLGYDLLNLFDQNAGESAETSAVAMHLARQLDKGMDAMAKRMGKEPEVVRKLVDVKLQAIAELPEKRGREAALARFVEHNPELRPLQDAVIEITKLSRTLLRQMVKSYPNPTEEQLATMQAIDANAFRYFTRFYAAFQGEAGRKHSRQMIEDHRKVLKKIKEAQKTGKEVTGITPAMRENAAIYARGLKYLKDNDVTIPDEDTLMETEMDDLDSLYHMWVDADPDAKKKIREEAVRNKVKSKDLNAVVRQTMIDSLLAKKATITEAELDNQTEILAEALLGLRDTGNPLVRFYRGFTEDRSILEHRKNIPQEIRDMFGEVRDPAQRVLMTISKQGELAARTKLLLNMRDDGLGKWVVKTTDVSKPGNGKFSVALSGETMGPLQGYSTTPEIATVINNSVEMLNSIGDALGKTVMNAQASANALVSKAGGGVIKMARANKIALVAYSLFSPAANTIGSPLLLLANGVNPFRYKGVGTGLENIKHAFQGHTGELSQAMREATRYGLTDSGQIQEARRSPQRFVREAVSTKPDALTKLGRVASRVNRTVIETTASSDNWVKPYIFADRVRVLKEFYAAEGINKTEEDIKLEASRDVKNTTLGYSRVLPVIKNLETMGISMFAPYFYSVFRTVGMSAVTAARDIQRGMEATNPEAKKVMIMAGTKRAIGTSAALAAPVLAMKALQSLILTDEEEEELEQMRKMLPEDAQLPDSLYLGKDKAGVPMFLRMSRFDPNGPATDLFRVMVDDSLDWNEKGSRAIDKLIGLFFNNRALVAILKTGASMAGDTEVNVRKTRLERSLPVVSDAVKAVAGTVMDSNSVEAFVEILDSFTPGMVNALDSRNNRVQDPANEAAALASVLMVSTGGRLDRADPAGSATAIGFELDKVRTEARDDIANAVLNGASRESLIDTFADHSEKELETMKKAKRVYEGMVFGMKMTPYQATEVLKESTKGNLTSTDIAGLRQGRILQDSESWMKRGSRVLSEQSLTRKTAGEDRFMSPQERKERDNRVKQVIRDLRNSGYKVQE